MFGFNSKLWKWYSSSDQFKKGYVPAQFCSKIKEHSYRSGREFANSLTVAADVLADMLNMTSGLWKRASWVWLAHQGQESLQMISAGS